MVYKTRINAHFTNQKKASVRDYSSGLKPRRISKFCFIKLFTRKKFFKCFLKMLDDV